MEVITSNGRKKKKKRFLPVKLKNFPLGSITTKVFLPVKLKNFPLGTITTNVCTCLSAFQLAKSYLWRNIPSSNYRTSVDPPLTSSSQLLNSCRTTMPYYTRRMTITARISEMAVNSIV